MSVPVPVPQCLFYAKGYCKNGNKCQNSHADPIISQQTPYPSNSSRVGNSMAHGNQIGGKQPTMPQAPKHIKRGELPCFAWKRGDCPKGKKCFYSHDPALKDSYNNTPSLPESTPHRKGGKGGQRSPQTFLEPRKEDSDREAAERRQKVLMQEALEKKRAIEAERARKAEEERKILEAEANQRRTGAERKAREEVLRRGEQRRIEEWRGEEERLRKEQHEEEERRKADERRREEARYKAEEQRKEEERRKEGERIRFEQTSRWEAAIILHKLVHGSIVTFAAGLDIREIITGFESCRITVKNLPTDAREAEITALFTQQGLDVTRFHVVNTRQVAGGKLEVDVVTDAKSGATIATGLDEIPFRNERLSFEIGVFNGVGGMGASSDRDTDVLVVSFPAPYVRYVVEFPEEAIANKVRQLNGRICSQRRVKVERNTLPPGRMIRNFIPNSIKISNLPASVTESDVAEFAGTTPAFVRRLPSPAAFADLDLALNHLRDHISRNALGQLVSFDITSRGDQGSGVVSVRARLSSHEVARMVHDSLEGKPLLYIGMTPWLRLRDPLLYTITIPYEQYQAQRSQWDELRENITDISASNLKVHQQNPLVKIQVGGTVKAATGALKVRVENLAAGERVEGWHPLLTSPNQDLLRRIREAGAYLKSNPQRQTLTLYGKSRAVGAAQQILAAELKRLENLDWVVNIPRFSIGFFVRQALPALREIFGEDCVQLDVARCQLTIRGPEEARHHVTRLIEESKQAQPAARSQLTTSSSCPICMDDISSPYKLGCGHEYCTACLRHFLTTAVETKSFPLVCTGNNSTCAVPIPIPLIQRFLPRASFDMLLEEVFNVYVNHHPQEIKNCTTPTCTQIYRTSRIPAVIQCPSCFVELCSACGMDGHNGQTCVADKAKHGSKKQERLSEQWIASQPGLRKCPRCSRLLEKSGGSNHILCPCGAHICWECMAVFPSTDIYTHMNTAHGGFYSRDEPPVPSPVTVQTPPVASAAPEYNPFQGVDYLEQVRLLQEAADRRRSNVNPQANNFYHPPRAPERQFQPQAAFVDDYLRAQNEELRAQNEYLRAQREYAEIERAERERAERERAQREPEGGGSGCLLM